VVDHRQQRAAFPASLLSGAYSWHEGNSRNLNERYPDIETKKTHLTLINFQCEMCHDNQILMLFFQWMVVVSLFECFLEIESFVFKRIAFAVARHTSRFIF